MGFEIALNHLGELRFVFDNEDFHAFASDMPRKANTDCAADILELGDEVILLAE